MFRNKEFAVKVLYATLFGMIVSFFYIAGAEIENTGSVDLMKTSFYVKWIMVAILAGIVVWFVWKLFYSIQSRQEKQAKQQAYKSYPFICYMLILFLLYSIDICARKEEIFSKKLIKSVLSARHFLPCF